MNPSNALRCLKGYRLVVLCGVASLFWYAIAHWVIVPIAQQAVAGNSLEFLNNLASKLSSDRIEQLSQLWASLQINVYAVLITVSVLGCAVPWLSKNKEGDRFDNLSILAFFWAFSVLIHQCHKGFAVMLAEDTLMTLVAIWVIFRPASLARFVTLLMVQLVCVILHMPSITNHWIFMAFGVVSILFCLIRLQLKSGEEVVSRDAIFRDISMVMAAQLIILYVVATLAKINWTYLDPDLSSAVSLIDVLRGKISLVPESSIFDYFYIYGSLIAEATIPLLILLPRTRIFGLWYGWAFHLILGVTGYLDFSTVVILYYSVFVSSDFAQRLSLACKDWNLVSACARWLNVPGRRLRLMLSLMVFMFLLAVVGQLVRMGFFGSFSGLRLVVKDLTFVVWLVVYLLTAVAFYKAGKVGKRRELSFDFSRMYKPVFLVGPLLVLLNSVSPYLGLKTESSFTMFSDLKTEAEEWNHVVVPESFRIFPFQDELVTILSSSDKSFQKFADSRERLVFGEFHRLALQKFDESVTYEFLGQVYQVEKIKNDPILSEPLSLLERKVMRYRPVAYHEDRRGRH